MVTAMYDTIELKHTIHNVYRIAEGDVLSHSSK